MTTIKVGSDFSGVGAFNQALIRLGIDYEEVFACDMDKYARQTFVHNYGEPKYYPTNVYERQIPSDPLDIYMTSPPCQAFSLAGKRLGKDDKRGILFFNSLEFIAKNKPRYFIFENVKGLLSDDNGKTFIEWVNLLGGKSVNGAPVIFPYDDAVPYHIYWKVLNAKHYGVPQNRERVFIIGIRDDADNNFNWPMEEVLNKRLKDVLEEEVDEKYFLSEKMLSYLVNNTEKQQINGNGFKFNPTYGTTISKAVTCKAWNRMDDEFIKVKSATSKGYEEATEGDSINLAQPSSETRRGRVGKGVAQTLDTGCSQGVMVGTWRTHEDGKGFRKTEDNTCPTIPARAREDGSGQPVVMQLNESLESGGKQPYQQNRIYDCEGINPAINAGQVTWGGNIVTLPNDYKIRRLTPRECFRLMDFPDSFMLTNEFNNIANSEGIFISLENKTFDKWNVKELDAKEKQKSKECACFTIKDFTNTEMKILNSNIQIEKIQNARLKIVAEMFLVKDFVLNTTTQIENGETLYLVSNNNNKSLKMLDKELLIQMEKADLEEKENRFTDYYLKLSLEENWKETSMSTILTMTQQITTYLIYIYSLPKESIINVILNYKNFPNNYLKAELLNLKMGFTQLSDSQAYKQAGNSIVVAVLAKIIANLKL